MIRSTFQFHPTGGLLDREHDARAGGQLGVHTAELPDGATPEHADTRPDPGTGGGGEGGRQGGR